MKPFELTAEFVLNNNLFKSSSSILIGFSGGPDSVFLVEFLHWLRREKMPEISFSLGYFNHNLRSDSEQEEAFVRAFAAERGLGLTSGRGDVRKAARDCGESLEMAGRKLRHEFLEQARSQSDTDLIALAHQRDDQVETVVNRLCRGCGITGLKGMLPLRGRIVRPLLNVSADTVRDYLNRNAISYYLDPTNDDQRIVRNFIRKTVIPVLCKVNSRSSEHIAAAASILAGIDQFVSDYCDDAFQKVILVKRQNYLILNRTFLATMSSPSRKELLHRLVDDLTPVYAETIDRLDRLVWEKPSCRLDISRKILVEAGRKKILFLLKKNLAKPKEIPIELRNYELILPFWEIKFSICEGKAVRNTPVTASIRPDVLFPLHIRTRRPGDRYRQAGSGAEKSLNRVFQEQGVPSALRDYWPVVADGNNKLIWLPGMYPSEEEVIPQGEPGLIMKTDGILA